MVSFSTSLKKFLIFQSVIVLITALLGLVITQNPLFALAMLLGGSVGSLAHIVAALIFFRERRATHVRRMLKNFYWAEVAKITFYVLGFFIAIRLQHSIPILGFFSGILVYQFTQLGGLLFRTSNRL